MSTNNNSKDQSASDSWQGSNSTTIDIDLPRQYEGEYPGGSNISDDTNSPYNSRSTIAQTPSCDRNSSMTSLNDSEHSAPDTETTFSVTGMTCSSCVNGIESYVSGLDGVVGISVDLMTGQVVIKHRSGAVSAKELRTAIEDMGFGAEILKSKKIILAKKPSGNAAQDADAVVESWFTAEGITCGSCVATIEAVLKGLAGVKEVDVQLLTGQVMIKHSARAIGVRELAESLTDAGYAAKLIEDTDEYSGADPSAAALKNMQKHRRSAAIRFCWSLVFAIPMLIISMIIDMALPESNSVAQAFHRKVFKSYSVTVICAFFIATAAQFTLGLYFYRHAFSALFRARTANMDVLIALGTTGAYVGSIISVVLQDGAGEQFFETSVFLMTFVLLGRWLEAIAKGRTVSAVEALVRMQPDNALLVSSDGERRPISARDIQLGDLLQVNTGMRVPCDGVVVSGQSEVDEALLTGESVPVHKTVDSSVTGGTLNLTKTFQMRATAVNESSTLARIVRLVRNAQSSKPQIQEVADRVASRFVPLVVIASLIVFVAWLIAGATSHIPHKWLVSKVMGGFGGGHGDGAEPTAYPIFALLNAISVLVIACPCALGLAAPTAIMVGTGKAASFGILVKGGGSTMEAASKLDIVAFDKTGTLTIGKPSVIDDCSEAPASKSLSLHFWAWLDDNIAAIEALSSHPLAAAIGASISSHKYESEDKSDPPVIQDYQEIPGRGMLANVTLSADFSASFNWPAQPTEVQLLIGKEDWVDGEENCVSLIPDHVRNSWLDDGCTVVVVGLRPVGHPGVILRGFALSDQPRPEARDVIKKLKARGLRVWMISGDHPAAANAIGRQLGVDNVMAGVLPDQKAEAIRSLQQSHTDTHPDKWEMPVFTRALQMLTRRKSSEKRRSMRVAMVGDGVNDAPALAQADVGIAIGSGTAAAMETAPALLMRSSLYSLVTLLDLSKTVFKRVKMNFVWASMYNIVCIPIAAGILYPAVDRGLPPVLAGLLMIASSLTVMVSSLTLKFYREPKAHQ